MATGLTEYVSEFISSTSLSDVPAEAREAAKRSVLDGLGLAVAGSRSEASEVASGYFGDMGCRGTSTVIGRGEKLPTAAAAFLNGLAIHVEDYDDTQLAVGEDRVYGLLTHPTAPVLPAPLAVGEPAGASGADVLTAYMIGVDVASKVAEAIDPRHYQDGFHSTGTAGAIGAAAAAAATMGLDAERTACALGLAAAKAGGLRENFGTMGKAFHAGSASQTGVEAAELARRGFTAASNILEAKRGFFQAAGGGYDEASIMGRLGDPWVFEHPGISIKPYPCGSLTHPAMSAAAQLREEHGFKPDDVERVRVGASRHMLNTLIHHRPSTELESKFSMEYGIAVVLIQGRAGLHDFTDEAVNRPEVQSLLERIDFYVNEAADAGQFNTMRSYIEVELRDGRVLEATAEFAKGSPQIPMGQEELSEKFDECVRWGGLEPDRGRRLAEQVTRLEEADSVGALLDASRVAGGA